MNSQASAAVAALQRIAAVNSGAPVQLQQAAAALATYIRDLEERLALMSKPTQP